MADAQLWDGATYSLGEIIVPEALNSSQLTVETLYTRYDGRCYRLIVSDKVSYVDHVSFDLRNPREVFLVFLEPGKHFCISFGYCHRALAYQHLSNAVTEFILTPEKKIWPPK